MKKVLMITYYWPPAGGIAVQRITKFCKYLPDYDWEPIILTVKDGNYENMDPSMLSETKQIKKVYRALSIEPHLFYHLLVSRFHKRGKTDKVVSEAVNTRTSLINRVAEHIRLNLFIPDTRIGWLHNAYRCGKKIIAELKPDIIFSTAPPYTPHLVARKLHKFSGIPWVADFRDPWVENTLYNTVNRLGLVVSINRLLEKKVLTQASALTFTGQQLRDLYLSKLDNSHAANATVITNGYDEEDFNALHVTTEAGSKFYITYFGSLYNKRFNALAFNVVKEFIKENKSIREHICVRFIGSVDRESKTVISDLIPANNLEFIDFMPYKEALKLLFQPQLFLLIVDQVPCNETITLGKLFDYLPTGNPVLGIGPIKGDSANILDTYQSGRVFDYGDFNGVKEFISNNYSLWQKGQSQHTDKDLTGLQRQNLTKDLAAVFYHLIA